jgi:HD-like signal output (HDOD) protein
VSDYTQYLKNLPIMPDIAAKVINMAGDSRDIDFSDLEEVIKVDPGLTTKVLKVANSSMYARQREIGNLQQAISMLGFKNIRNLVVLVTASSLFRHDERSPFLSLFWKQGIITAFAASYLADKTGKQGIREEAFLAGLMCNIGQVALFFSGRQAYEDLYARAIRDRIPAEELENVQYDTNHRLVGAALLKNWNFPDMYCDVAQEQGQRNITSSHKMLIILVSIAEFLAANLVAYADSPLGLEEIRHYLPFIGLTMGGLERLAATVMDSVNADSLYNEIKGMFGID